MSEELKAQDCELEYWNQQAEDYALVQIPCEDLRAIINRAWEAPAFNSALTAAEAERNRAQLACQQIAERLTASEARAKAAEERVGELEAQLNTPEVEDFAKATVSEAQHQRARWGSSHDAGKQPLDWFWLIGYLAQKAATAHMAGDAFKAKHHTISTAAALANWHAAISGQHTEMRPGIETPEFDRTLKGTPDGR